LKKILKIRPEWSDRRRVGKRQSYASLSTGKGADPGARRHDEPSHGPRNRDAGQVAAARRRFRHWWRSRSWDGIIIDTCCHPDERFWVPCRQQHPETHSLRNLNPSFFFLGLFCCHLLINPPSTPGQERPLQHMQCGFPSGSPAIARLIAERTLRLQEVWSAKDFRLHLPFCWGLSSHLGPLESDSIHKGEEEDPPVSPHFFTTVIGFE
jgi:hypothetical protein